MVDYNKMTVVALKALLKKRGLDDGGWKSALVFRLEKDDEKKTADTKKEKENTKKPEPKKADSSKKQESSIFDDPSDSEPENDEQKTPSKKQDSTKKTPVKKETSAKKSEPKKTGQESKSKTSASKKDESKKWIDILEESKDSKIIMRELQKIHKVDALKQWNKEINDSINVHKIRVLPITPDDLSELVIVDLLEKSEMSTVKLFLMDSPAKMREGWIEFTFLKLSERDEAVAALKEFRENITICQNSKGNIGTMQSWNEKWLTVSKRPLRDDLDKYRLFAPSLPQSVNEDELWSFFPTARDIILIGDKPRQHAYLGFLNEASMKKAVADLNARGPPRDDLKFARLLRITDLQKLGLARSSKPIDNKGQKKTGSRIQNRTSTGFSRNLGRAPIMNRPVRGPPQFPVKPLFGGRRPMAPPSRRTPLMGNPRGRDMPQDRRPTGPPREAGRPRIQNAFAQLEGPSVDVAPQVINTLHTILGHVGGQRPPMNTPPRPQGQSLPLMGPPMQMREMPREPPRDNRRMESRDDRGMKRSHSPMPSHMDIKRTREQYDMPPSQPSYSSQGVSMRDEYGREPSSRSDYDRPQAYASSVNRNYPSQQAPEPSYSSSQTMERGYGAERDDVARDSRNNGRSYQQSSRSEDYIDSRAPASSQPVRSSGYEDRYQTSSSMRESSYSTSHREDDNPYKQSSSTMASGSSSSYALPPDYDYRAAEENRASSYGTSDRLSSALSAVSKIKQLKESLAASYPSGGSSGAYRSSYY